MEDKLYFYAAVIDGNTESDVTTTRYKNFVDYALKNGRYTNNWDTLIKDYLDWAGICTVDDLMNVQWESFFMDYLGGGIFWIAVDEDNIELSDLESNDVTFRLYCRKLLKQNVKEKKDNDESEEIVLNGRRYRLVDDDED